MSDEITNLIEAINAGHADDADIFIALATLIAGLPDGSALNRLVTKAYQGIDFLRNEAVYLREKAGIVISEPDTIPRH